MLNLPVFRVNLKENRKNWLILTGFLFCVILINLVLYSQRSWIQTLLSGIPEPFVRMFAMEAPDESLTGYLSCGLYGFWLLLIPMVYTVRLSDCLTARSYRRGSFVYFVGTPVGRGSVIFTHGYFLAFSLFCMLAAGTVFGLVFSWLLCPGQLETAQFLLLNIGGFCLHFALSGLTFFLSCAGMMKKRGWILEGGIPAFFFLMYLLGNLGGGMEVFHYVSLFSLFDREGILAGEWFVAAELLLLLILGGGFYWLSMFLYKKRDFSLGNPEK